MSSVDTRESVAAQLTTIADRLDKSAHRPLAMREGFVAAQQAGTLLGGVIEQGLIEVPVAVKEDYTHLKGTPVSAHRPPLPAAWLHPAVRFFHLAIGRWLGDALPGMVRLEPGGLTRFDNTQLDDEENQDLWAGRLATMADACRVLAKLLTDTIKVPDGARRAPKPDGTFTPPTVFWWNGNSHQLQPRTWQLLEFMQHSDRVRVQELAEKVFDNEYVTNSTITSAISRANKELLAVSPNAYSEFRLTVKSGYVLRLRRR